MNRRTNIYKQLQFSWIYKTKLMKMNPTATHHAILIKSADIRVKTALLTNKTLSIYSIHKNKMILCNNLWRTAIIIQVHNYLYYHIRAVVAGIDYNRLVFNIRLIFNANSVYLKVYFLLLILWRRIESLKRSELNCITWYVI